MREERVAPMRLQRPRRSARKQPKSLVECIVEAIDEAVPGRGAEIYRRGFQHFYGDVEARRRTAAERELPEGDTDES
jgi:hypothetical protein